MTDKTVFDSNMNKLKQNVEELNKLKVDEGLLTKALSLVGRASISEKAVEAHNNLIEAYTNQMIELLNITEQMKKNKDTDDISMKEMSDHINKLKSLLDIQKANIEKSEATILKHKETITEHETKNTAFEEANRVLDISNAALTSQNEEQKKINQNLTNQNQAQKKTIANMKGNLTELTNTLKAQTKTLKEQTEEIYKIIKSNTDLNTQLKQLEATQAQTERNAKIAADEFKKITQQQDEYINKIKAAQKLKIAFLRNSAKKKLKEQQEEFEKSIARIKQESDKSIVEKEAKIKEITEEHTKEQNKITEQQNKIQATSDATIGQLKTELSNLRTDQQLGKEDQEKQKKMLRTETRILPLGWKNSKGFNIGNITTQVRGEKPYNATDTIDHYLYTLFHGKIPGEEQLSTSSRHVPIIQEKRSGGKNNRLRKSKKSKKSKNNKTKKQRKH